MKTSGLRLALGCALAVVVPGAALHFSADADRLAGGLTASPFGWARVLIVHLIGALPLGVIVAGRVRAAPAANDVVRGLWAVIGLALAGLAALVCPGIGDAVSGGEFGALPLLVLRAALAFGLVLPWCVWAVDPPASGDTTAKPRLVFALGVGFAVLPGGLYADAVAAARTEQALDLTNRADGPRARGTDGLGRTRQRPADREEAAHRGAESAFRRAPAPATRRRPTAGRERPAERPDRPRGGTHPTRPAGRGRSATGPARGDRRDGGALAGERIPRPRAVDPE